MANNKATTKRFSPKLHIKKGDTVMAIAGNDKGNTGVVLEVMPSQNKAIVEGLRMVTKHIKATQTNEGGVQKIEAPIHLSNLMVVDPKTGQPTRVGRKEVNGVRVRYSKKSGETI